MLADERIENFAVQPITAQADATEAFAHRPELKSLELATKIYHKKEQIALAEMLPTVALTANYLVSNPNAYNGFKKDFAGMYNVGVLVRVPLSAWWEGTYKRNAARAETVIKKLETQEAREKVELQVNQSVYKVNEAGKQLTASTRNMERAKPSGAWARSSAPPSTSLYLYIYTHPPHPLITGHPQGAPLLILQQHERKEIFDQQHATGLHRRSHRHRFSGTGRLLPPLPT